ncbi:dynein heavy chain [Achlya hypogyna]|uniref:Dynein heavy chain n=1 Tax=Achlya hypogyna TaxID=1202772 RepID=A0A1V9ZA16_ACHHY|nr:dynein heavy chain [Achlya hypogyna]
MNAGSSSSRHVRLSARQEIEDAADPYAQSNQWIDVEEYHRLSQLVAVEKEAELRVAHAPPKHMKQTWHSPLHVPLSKRKQANLPLPEALKPVAPTPPSNNAPARCSHRTVRLKETVASTEQRASMQRLKEDNQELYARLVARFRRQTQAASSPVKTGALIQSIEDAVLYFICEKHRRNVLYFQGPDPKAGFRPYDVRHVAPLAANTREEHYLVSATHLVHCKPYENAEVIPISEWVYHSRMFDHLLRSIPLFQQLLRRRVFGNWAAYVRHKLYRGLRQHLLATLHWARPNYAATILAIQAAGQAIQTHRALSLGTHRDKPSMLLSEWRSFQAKRFKELEAQLTDSRAMIHRAIEALVESIRAAASPDTTLQELNATDMYAMRQAYPGWKSIPMSHLKVVQKCQARQVQQAQRDLIVFPAFFRLTQYLYVEALYRMVAGSARHLQAQLTQDAAGRAITVAVSFVDTTHVCLTPSEADVSRFVLESVESLGTLAAGFASSRPVTAYLSAEEAAIVDAPVLALPRLQDVLEHSTGFAAILDAIRHCICGTFARVAQLIEQFDGLRPIYNGMHELTLPAAEANVFERALPSVLGVVAAQIAQLDAWQSQCHRIQASWDVGFVDVHCRGVLGEVLEKLTAHRARALELLTDVTSRGIFQCVSKLKDAIALFDERPQLIEAFCAQKRATRAVLESEDVLLSEMRRVDEAFSVLKTLAPAAAGLVLSAYNSIHALHAKYNVSLAANLKFAKTMLPQIAKQILAALQRYTAQCKKLMSALEANVTYLHPPLGKVDFDAKLFPLREIKAELDKIQEATTQYNSYQSIMGMKVTPVAMLHSAMALYEEVHEVWAVSADWKRAHHVMLTAKFTTQAWANHLATTQDFQLRASKIVCRFENKVFASVKEEIAAAVRQLPLLVELGASYVKPSHWEQIFKVLGTVLPTASLTLQQLGDAHMWQHVDKLQHIAYHARVDAETEAALARMKARWAATELPCANLELDPAVVSDLLVALDDDLVLVQQLMQTTSQPSLYESLALWSDEINYIQDTLELWLATQTDWLKLDRLFSLPDVQTNVRHATLEFHAASRKWRSMMKGVQTTTSLQQCVREVTNRVFLAETKQLFERLWRQLVLFLQEKRREFPRFNFISDRHLLEIMAGTTLGLRDPSNVAGSEVHVTRVIATCFEHLVRATLSVKVTKPHSLLGEAITPESHDAVLEPTSSMPALETLDELYTTEIAAVGGRFEEHLTLETPIRISQRPEIWMHELEKALHRTLRDCVKHTITEDANSTVLQLYIDDDNSGNLMRATKRIEHIVASCPLQVVLLAFRIYFTGDCNQLINDDPSVTPAIVLGQQRNRATEWVAALKQATTDKARHACSTMALCCFNHIDILQRLSASAHAKFDWGQMLQYRWSVENQSVLVSHGLKAYEYGCVSSRPLLCNASSSFEYLGPHTTVALTPLTERIMWHVSIAFRLHAGALVHGETGVSKQVAVRELVQSLGALCVVYDCSIQLCIGQLSRVLAGIVPCNAYALVVGLGTVGGDAIGDFLHQLKRLQHALKTHKDKILLGASPVSLHVHDRSAINFGVCCKLTLHAASNSVLQHCARAFVPIAAAFAMVDVLVLVRLYLSAHGFEHVDALAAELHAFILTHEAGYMKAPGEQITVRTVKKIMDLAGAYKSLFAEEGHVLACAILHTIGSRISPLRKRVFLRQLHRSFPTFHHVELDITRTQARIHEAIAAKRLVPTPILSRKVYELHHLSTRHAVNIVTGDVATGKSTIVAVLAAVRRPHSEQPNANRPVVYRIAAATLNATEFYGHFAEHTNEWVDGILTHFVHEKTLLRHRSHDDVPWLVFDGDTANACIEPLYAISDASAAVHLPNGERLDTSRIKLFFESCSLEAWSPASLNRFGVMFVPADSLPYTVFIKSWLLRVEATPSLASDRIKAAKHIAQLMRSQLPCLLNVCRRHWQPHLPFHASTLVQKLVETLDTFFHALGDAPTLDKDVVLVYLCACTWSLGAYLAVEARGTFHDALLDVAPELARHRLFTSGRTVFDIYAQLDKHKVALVSWQSKLSRMDWPALAHHRFVFVPNEASARVEHLIDVFASAKRHAIIVGERGSGKSSTARRAITGLATRGCTAATIFMASTMGAADLQDLLMADMERKMKGLYGPSTGKQAVVYVVEDVHLSSVACQEQLRQVVDTKGVYQRKTFDWIELQHFALLGLASTHPIEAVRLPLRLLRHFHLIWSPPVAPDALFKMFRSLPTYVAEHFGLKFGADATWHALQLPLLVFELLSQEPMEAPVARFSLGDLVLVYSHVLRAARSNFESCAAFEALVYNFTATVFGARTRVAAADASFFKKLLPSIATTLDFAVVKYADRPLYGDKGDGFGYVPMTLREATNLFVKGHEKFQWHHPSYQKSVIKHLTPFPQAIDSMLAVLFGLGDLRQHLLLLGPRGCGKRTSLLVVCGLLSYNYVEIRQGHDALQRLKETLLHVGTHGKHTVLYLAMDELGGSTVAAVLNLLRDGDIAPALYTPDDVDAIAAGISQLPSLTNTNPSKAQCVALYRQHLQSFLHVACGVVCDRRLGDMLQHYSSLLEVCTLRLFRPWPAVAFATIYDHMNVLPTLQPVVWQIHASYMNHYGRSSRVNPTEQYKAFVTGLSVYHIERTKTIHDVRANYSLGLKRMQQHTSTIKALGSSERILTKKLRALDITLDQLQARYDKLVAAENSARAALDAKEVAYLAMKTRLDEERRLIQAELDQTIPELQTAIQSLSRINKLHITEMKSFTSPPDLVRLVMQAVCVLLGLGSTPTWEDALFVLCDMKFLDRLRTFDKDNIPDATMRKLDRVIQHPKFNEDEMKRASIASTSLCRWVLALARYHRVMTVVRPKQNTLTAAESNLDHVQREVDSVREVWAAHVRQSNEVQQSWHTNGAAKLALQLEYDELVARTRSLERVSIAFESLKTILRKENHRIQALEQASLGDSVLLTAIFTYVAGVAPSNRRALVAEWSSHLQAANVVYSADLIQAMAGKEGLQELRATCAISDTGVAMNLYYLHRWKDTQVAKHKFLLLVDPRNIAANWIKTVEHHSLEVVSADDPMLLARFEMSPPNPNYILLVDRVAQCEESALWAFLRLLVVKKLRHPVYFIADTDCTRRWSIEMIEAFVTVSFELQAEDLQAHIVAIFHARFAPDDEGHLRGLHEALLDDFRHRTTALDGLLKQLSHPSLLVSDDEISNLAAQMDALTQLSAAIDSKNESIVALERSRDNFAELGRRGRALLEATATFGGRCHAMDVLEDGIWRLQDVDDATPIDDICHQLTVGYLQDVLHGLPERLHVAFTFFVALAIAATEPHCAALVHMCWEELQAQTGERVPGVHLPLDIFVQSPTATHRAATKVVREAIVAAVVKQVDAAAQRTASSLSMAAVLSGEARRYFTKDGRRHAPAVATLIRQVQPLLVLPIFAPLLDDIDAYGPAYEAFLAQAPRFLQDTPRTQYMRSLPAIAKLMLIVFSHHIIIPNMMQQVVNAYVPEINYELLSISGMAQEADGRRPILLQYDVHDTVHPLWCIIETALGLGIRDADIWVFSFATPDVLPACLRAFKDASVHGGWLILQDMATISSSDLMDLNRQFEIMANGDMSMHGDFRLWLLDETPSSLLARLPSTKLHTFYFNVSFKMEDPLQAPKSPLQRALHFFHGIAHSGTDFGGLHTASPFSSPVSLYELEKAEFLLDCIGDKVTLTPRELAFLVAPLYQGKSADATVRQQIAVLLHWIFEIAMDQATPGLGVWYTRLQRTVLGYTSQRPTKDTVRRSCEVLLPMDMKLTAVVMGLPSALDAFFDAKTMLAIVSTLAAYRARTSLAALPPASITPPETLVEGLMLQLPRETCLQHVEPRLLLHKWAKAGTFPSLLHEAVYMELLELEAFVGFLWRDLRALPEATEAALAKSAIPCSWLRFGYACPLTLVTFVAWVQSATSFYAEYLCTHVVPPLQLQFFQNAHAVLFTLLQTYARQEGVGLGAVCLCACMPTTAAMAVTVANVNLRNARWDAEKALLYDCSPDDALIQSQVTLCLAPRDHLAVGAMQFACPVYPYYYTVTHEESKAATAASPIQFYVWLPTDVDISVFHARGTALVLNEAQVYAPS